MEDNTMKSLKSMSNSKNHAFYKFMMLILFALLSLASFSQESNSLDKTESPYFVVLSENSETDQLPLKKTSAAVNIVGVIADVTINQVYRNEGNSALEAIYTFPASSNAAVYAMEMKIGSRKIIAKIEEKEKARADYEQAKEEGRRTSLLEQQRPNVFTMNVANIMPGDEIEVSLKYTEMLVPEKGTYTFIYPTVVGPRYSEKPSGNDDFVSSPYQKSGEDAFYNFDINVHLSTGVPIQNVFCKTHMVNISYPQTNVAEITLDPSEDKGGNRDFVMEYNLSGDKIKSGLMLYEHEDENFFLLMVQPPKQIMNNEIPPREYIFIVDVSGSMNGFPLDVSKKVMRNLVVNLRPEDKFNVMVFAGTSGWMSDTSVAATLENVEKAVYFIDNQRGAGGTNLLSALKKALAFPRMDESLSRSFVIVTDGYVSIEKEAFDLIRNNCDNANVFAFGIGSSVNRYLIEGIAHVGMSEPLIILNQNEADLKAEKFREYINYPVLTQIKKSFQGFDAYDVEPLTVPDVLAERPVIIYGKYKGEPKGKITIKGYAGKKTYKQIFEVNEVSPSSNNAAIRYLWARKKIQLVDDYTRVTYSGDTRKEVTELGLKYNLMTEYTSFIAIEEDRIANDGELKTVKQPLPMPQGVPNSAIGFEMEIDEENFSYFFHEEVKIMTELPSSVKKEIIQDIESNLITQLNLCFSSYLEVIHSIEITVNANGQIINIKVKGNNLSKEFENCIRETAEKANYSSYGLNTPWKFKIIF